MLTVRIHEGEARGRWQLLFDNRDVYLWIRGSARPVMGTIFLVVIPLF